ncbi:recombinase family protein [Arthrobacter sp. ISL-65]|uniref:recombinase family protein n=1 Tax=Arthrobacter sp. ISL-65 TaxID=2819112 RepID=UPI001BECDE19|nr:recombinase family protein [Arthrobacter sp. ISL-65]MBT2550107.1 recombinase family protein [Arthrobacter sp. ISL-65]
MSALVVGYARVSTDEQDLTAQQDALSAMGIEPDRIYVDHGLTGSNLNRPGLRKALAACRAGDTFAVVKLDRLARSVRDAHQIADDLAARGVKLSIGGSVHDPSGTHIRLLLFNVLAMVAEFEGDLIRARTREGMKVAKAKGRLRGKSPNSHPPRKHTWLKLHAAGEHTMYELAELFSVGRSTVYRALERARRNTET